MWREKTTSLSEGVGEAVHPGTAKIRLSQKGSGEEVEDVRDRWSHSGSQKGRESCTEE